MVALFRGNLHWDNFSKKTWMPRRVGDERFAPSDHSRRAATGWHRYRIFSDQVVGMPVVRIVEFRSREIGPINAHRDVLIVRPAAIPDADMDEIVLTSKRILVRGDAIVAVADPDVWAVPERIGRGATSRICRVVPAVE